MNILSILRNKTSSVVSVTSDTTIAEVVQVLAQQNVGAVLVMDKDELLGVLSERDIVREMARRPQGVRSLTAAALMTGTPVTIGLDAGLEDAMKIMTHRRLRHLPALDGGRIVGVVSIGDVVKAMLDEQASEVDSMRAYVTGG